MRPAAHKLTQRRERDAKRRQAPALAKRCVCETPAVYRDEDGTTRCLKCSKGTL